MFKNVAILLLLASNVLTVVLLLREKPANNAGAINGVVDSGAPSISPFDSKFHKWWKDKQALLLYSVLGAPDEIKVVLHSSAKKGEPLDSYFLLFAR